MDKCLIQLHFKKLELTLQSLKYHPFLDVLVHLPYNITRTCRFISSGFFFQQWFEFIAMQHENFERFKSHLVSSITVSTISTCLVMQCKLFKPTLASQRLIILLEHFLMQIKADMMFAVTDHPAQGGLKSLQVAFHFKMNEKLQTRRDKHKRMMHVIASFWDF